MRRTRLSLSLASLLLASAVQAQVVTDVEVGYRFVDVKGNEDMYRTQVGEREGFLLRGLTLQTADFGGKLQFIDQFRLDVADIGAGPAGMIRLEAVREGTYRLRFNYRHSEHTSFLPEFANPFLGQGIIPGQHTWERDRDVYDVEVEILPGKAVTPILGYTYSQYRGPGATTYHFSQDEFRLTEKLDDKEQEFRAGLAFNAGPVNGHFIQGWRKYDSNTELTLAPGGNNGNNSITVLDKDVSVTDLTRTMSYESTAPVTNAVVNFRLFESWRLVGLYVRAKDDLDSNLSEASAGNLVSFAIDRYAKGWRESSSANAINTYWRGAGRLEGNILNVVDVSAGFARRENTLEGTALIDGLFSGTTTFTNVDPKDIRVIIDAKTGVEKTEDTWDVQASARHLGPVGIRVGYSQSNQDLKVSEDVSEIVIPGGQSGQYERKIDRFDAALSFAMAGFSFTGAYKHESADEPVMRTDFLDKDTFSLRASYRFKELLDLYGVYRDTQIENDRTGYAYDASMRDWRLGFSVSPIKQLTLGFNYGQSDGDTSIPYKVPYTFDNPDPTNLSYQEESGRSWEASLTGHLKPVTLEAGYGWYENTGTYALKLQRARIMADIDITKLFGVAGEWCWDKYEEKYAQPVYGNYEANRIGVFLRIHQ